MKNDENAEKYKSAVGKPNEYVERKCVFYGHEFYIDERVFIPQFFSEQLITYAIRHIPKKSTIVDVGTGCGNIAIALAKAMPKSKIYAADIDQNALEVAKTNIKKHNVENVFIARSNYVDEINIDSPTAIVACLPYGSSTLALIYSDLEAAKESIISSLLKKNYSRSDAEICAHSALKMIVHMPQDTVFHRRGNKRMSSYKELFSSILNKKWTTVLLFETQGINMDEIDEAIPDHLKRKHTVLTSQYTITKVLF